MKLQGWTLELESFELGYPKLIEKIRTFEFNLI